MGNDQPTKPSATLTLQDWVTQAARAMNEAGLYFGHGTDNAIDESCWMASSALNLGHDFDESLFQKAITDTEKQALNRLLEARIESKKPLAYLLGEAWFGGLKFIVNEAVLVPRSPLAEVIFQGFEPWVSIDAIERVLDVGTGCGCLAALTAHCWPHLKVDAVDISPKALALARANVDRLGLGSRVNVVESDLFASVKEGQWDVILANPPYVPIASMATLPTEYTHEPSLGLVAGSQGLDVVIPLLEQAYARLSDQGVVICEVGEAAEAFDQWAQQQGLEVVWLELENGGEGVFMATKAALARLSR